MTAALLAGLCLALPLQWGCPPALPPPPRHPTSLPPQPPPKAPACPNQQMLQGGRWLWVEGAWTWEAPRCVPRPPELRDGCVWQRGRWTRATPGAPLTFEEGRLVCP